MALMVFQQDVSGLFVNRIMPPEKQRNEQQKQQRLIPLKDKPKPDQYDEKKAIVQTPTSRVGQLC